MIAANELRAALEQLRALVGLTRELNRRVDALLAPKPWYSEKERAQYELRYERETAGPV